MFLFVFLFFFSLRAPYIVQLLLLHCCTYHPDSPPVWFSGHFSSSWHLVLRLFFFLTCVINLLSVIFSGLLFIRRFQENKKGHKSQLLNFLIAEAKLMVQCWMERMYCLNSLWKAIMQGLLLGNWNSWLWNLTIMIIKLIMYNFKASAFPPRPNNTFHQSKTNPSSAFIEIKSLSCQNVFTVGLHSQVYIFHRFCPFVHFVQRQLLGVNLGRDLKVIQSLEGIEPILD